MLGNKAMTAVALTLLTGCASSGQIAVRPLPTVLAQGDRPVSFRIAEARGQYALGNVALALESFRKALRDDPASVDALVGMAGCYDAMGRFDVSRGQYEAALAIAPADTRILGQFAASLQHQGLASEAEAVRQEMAARAVTPLAAAAAPAAVTVAMPAARPVPAITLPAADVRDRAEATVTLVEVAPILVAPVPASIEAQVPLEPAAPAVVLASGTISAPQSAPVPLVQQLALVVPPTPRPVIEQIVAVAPTPAALPVPVVARIIPTPVIDSIAAAVEPAPFDPPLVAPVEVADAMPAAIGNGPRLERLTLGEVALVTTPARQPARPRPSQVPRAMAPAILARAATPVRFSSLAPPLADQQSLRTDGRERVLLVLNAARVQGLAARTRHYLAGQGVRQALVGDAPRVRDHSVIIAPPSQWARAKALARSLKFGPRMIRGSRLMLVLGRDSVDAARG